MLLAILDGPDRKAVQSRLTPRELDHYRRLGDRLRAVSGGEDQPIKLTEEDWRAMARLLPIVLAAHDEGNFHAATGYWFRSVAEMLEKARSMTRGEN